MSIPDDFIILIMTKKEKKTIQEQAMREHSTLTGFCLEKVLKSIPKQEVNN